MSLDYTVKPGEVIFTFIGDDPSNTKIFSSAYSDTEPLYTVHQELQHSHGYHKATVIQKASEPGAPPHVLATIQYRNLSGDRIAFDAEAKTSPITVEKYLHGKLTHYEYVTPSSPSRSSALIILVRELAFEDEHGKKYQWHGDHPHIPKLYIAGDLSTPIAELHSRGQNPDHPKQYDSKSILVLAPAAVEIQDQVVVSFLWILNRTQSWLAAQVNLS
ncbi:hypothetical protein SISSUDRAFT_1035853 [Sistotremastrum suecicum HHB10207 ss-3]|uniref:DUF6593 domain-containing protein n=1 Tax=Sistotremastrum suecicum HHB10207 ss-3 TaxID=1314776 RepID=A0A166A755_9AGAM|nr:hypothetical protein SISSUDRAFT_1035853 [Sistotremastrum suecicum HHB10207 ss-3]